jgi:spoIIIJ-associated protein
MDRVPSAPARTRRQAEVGSSAQEPKKSESVASDGDLFRQSEIVADYIEGLLDILDYDSDIDAFVAAGRPMVEVVDGRLQPLVGGPAPGALTRLAVAWLHAVARMLERRRG